MQLPDIVLDAWRKQRGDYVFVSKKVKDEWEDFSLQRRAWSEHRLTITEPGADNYFCFNSFSKGRRMEKFFEPSPYLYADLDEVHPNSLQGLEPTITWRTSRGKYQCAWQVDKYLPLEVHKRFNQGLTYLTGADRGGWSVTKVLRIPGTKNHKYGKPQLVELLWEDGPTYGVQDIARAIQGIDVPDQSGESLTDLGLPDMTSSAVMRTHRDRLSDRAMELLNASQARIGERSDRLWELECLLIDAGVSPEETLILVRDTVWNKYAGQTRELTQLWKEVRRAQSHLGRHSVQRAIIPQRKLTFETVDQFMARSLPTEKWMVDGIWSHDSHGLIAGEAKTYKSLIATELAIAVATGKSFLGVFDIPQRGPAWIIQEENTPAMMQDRIHKITLARGCGGEVNGSGLRLPEDIPVKLMNNQGFNLRDEDHLDFLERSLAEAKTQHALPKLLVLDPFYLLAPGINESESKDVSPILRRLLHLKQKWGSVGILIVHHYNKPRQDEDRHPGNRISGSNVFYRWFESAIYLSKGKEPGQVVMNLEHRGHAPVGSIHIDFDMGEMGEDEYFVDVKVKRSETSDLRKGLKLLIEGHPKGVKLTSAAETLDISKDRVKTLAKNLKFRIVQGPAEGDQGRPGMMIVP